MFPNRIRSLGPLLIAWVVLFGVRVDRTFAGVYEDLGTPVIGAWKQGAWVFWDPCLKRDLLWSQECSQDGAILYCMDIETGQVLEEYDIPAREIGGIRSSPDGTLYIKGVSGLTQPGNELLRFNPYRRTIEQLGLPGTPRNRIASFTVGWDGNIYVGTHREGRLFRFSPLDHTWKDLGQVVPAPVLPRQHIWLQNIQQLSDKTILASVVRAPAAQVVAVNPVTGSFHEVKPTQSGGYQIYGKDLIESTGSGIRFYDVHFQMKSEISYFTFDGADQFDTDTRFSLAAIDKKNGVILRVGREVIRADLHQKRLKRCAKLPFEGILLFTSDDRAVVVDHEANRFCVVPLDGRSPRTLSMRYKGKRGTQICGLNKTSDGIIYGTNIIGMHIFRHDPGTGTTEDMGEVGWPGGEVYNVIEHKGRIYFGTYGGGYWGVYDPERPWSPDPETDGRGPTANPYNFGRLGGEEPNAVNRPFEYVAGPQGRIFIAARANYRSVGGALVEFDPDTGNRKVFRDLKRSVRTVTADDTYIFAGTNIHGGRGSGDQVDVATLFVHDPKTGTRIFEQAVVPEAKAIVSLRYNPSDQCVYGTTDNQILFALDPRSFQVLGKWTIRSPGTPLAGVPEDVGMIHITAASDGCVYGVTSRDLFRFVPEQKQIEYLDTPPIPDLYQIVEGEPGVFFMAARSHLLKYRLQTPVYFR